MSHENDWAIKGPAPYSNRFVVHIGETHARVAFGEVTEAHQSPEFRAGVMMTIHDVVGMAKLILHLAKETGYVDPAEGDGKQS